MKIRSRFPVLLLVLCQIILVQKLVKKYRPLSIKKNGIRVHMACLRTRKGTVLCFDTNTRCNHAEINVIRKAKKKFTRRELLSFCHKEGGFVLEIVHYNMSGKGFYSSKPCKECQKRIDSCPGIVEVLHS